MVNKVPLPIGWKWVALDDISADEKNAIVDGPFGSNLKVSEYIQDTDGVPVLTTKNLEHGYDNKLLRFITLEKFKELKRSEVRGGDILVAKIGSCGKTGIYPSSMPSAIIPANLLKVTVHPDNNKMFIYYYLNSPVFGKFLKEIITATAQPAFGLSKFKRLPIPICSLPEQEQIVAKIEELFSQLDAGVAGLKRAQVLLKQYRSSVLKAAFEGRLVPHDPNDERSEEMLNILNTETIETKEKKSIPKTWVRTELGKFFDEIYRYPTFYGMEHLEHGIPVIRVGHIQEDGKISHDWEDYWFISDEVAAQYPKTVLKYQDLVLSVRGSVGKIGIVDEKLIGSQMSPNCIRLSINQNIAKPIFIYYFLKSLSGQKLILESSNATTIRTIKASSISSIPINLPSIGEQERIINGIEMVFSILNNLEIIIINQLGRASKLRTTILKNAFLGNLLTN
jgi:type I restriction enzyme S subunit